MTKATNREKPPTTFQWLLDQAKVGAFIALIALAITFAPRENRFACWACLVLAYVFGVATLKIIADKKKLGKGIRLASYAVLLVATAFLGMWLTDIGPFPRPGQAFSVTVEYRMHAGPGHATYFWLRTRSPNGCSLRPALLAMFVRITNLQSRPTRLRDFSIISGNDIMPRLRTDAGTLFLLFEKGKVLGPLPSRPAQFGYGDHFVGFPLTNLELRYASPITKLQLLDTLLEGEELEPHKPVGGWVFLQRPSLGAFMDTAITLTDARGHSYTYLTAKPAGKEGDDVADHQMIADPTIDVSDCTLDSLQR